MEKALTIKKVNAAFAALGIPERLARARGYFFFYGGAAPTWPKSAVFVERLNDKSLAEWVYARDYAESQARPTLFPYYEQYMREIGKA
jgi:hypothetical protein